MSKTLFRENDIQCFSLSTSVLAVSQPTEAITKKRGERGREREREREQGEMEGGNEGLESRPRKREEEAGHALHTERLLICMLQGEREEKEGRKEENAMEKLKHISRKEEGERVGDQGQMYSNLVAGWENVFITGERKANLA